MLINFLYKVFRIVLYPFIVIADFFQNNLTSIFTPMNMGPVSESNYSNYIKKKISGKYFVLDFGSGAGFFCTIFNPKKYLGVEINKNFVITSQKKYKKYTFKLLKGNYLKNFKKKVNLIFINNVLHHLSDKEIIETFNFFKKNLKKKTKIFIIEPLFPTTFFSIEFFMKVLDIGDNIKTKKNYLKLFKSIFYIERHHNRKVGIGKVLVIEGLLNKN